MPEYYNPTSGSVRVFSAELYAGLAETKKALWFLVVDVGVPAPSPNKPQFAIVGSTAERTMVVDQDAVDREAAIAEDLGLQTDAELRLPQLQAARDTDPTNISQVSTQLRYIKHILFFVLKRVLRLKAPTT